MFEPHDRTRHVLVVDDNNAIHDDFRKILEVLPGSSELDEATAAFFGERPAADLRPRYQVTTASQGQEGLELVSRSMELSEPFDLAFVDMQMPPGWDGLETIEHLWGVDRLLQVVICTAYSDDTWSDVTERLGQRDNLLILKKPFDTAEVLQLAAALSAKRHLTREAAAKMEELERIAAIRTRDLEAAHHESESLLSAIASLLVGIDAQGCVKRWNESAVQTFGVAADDAIGTAFEDLPIDWKDRDHVLQVLRTDDRQKGRRVEVEFRDDDGTSRVLGLSSYPVAGSIQSGGLLLLGTELTRQRMLQQQLQQAQKLESIGQLAAGVAHEINTPMQYVGDNIDYLKTVFQRLHPFLEDCGQLIDRAQASGFEPELTASLDARSKKIRLATLSDDVSEALNDSADGVQHVSRIVRAMKEFSHPGLADKTPVDLNHALETTITVAKNEWKYVADVETDLATDLAMVSGFPGELNQVFLNLIVNAAHAIGERSSTGEGPRGLITVATRRGDGVARIEISDNGGGIPKAIRDRVFDPFFTTKEVGKGTGQGLAIAYSVIVQKHDGRIWFHVEEGVGTTFFIELPAGEKVHEEQGEDVPELVAAV